MSTQGATAGREPNRLLLAARLTRRLTQQQLAEAVAAAHRQLFEREAAIDADHVSKLERGLITWPNRRYREALRAVLDAATDAELGFYHRRSGDSVEGAELTDGGGKVQDVRRNEFLRLVTGLGAGAGLGVGAGLSDPVGEVLSLAATPVAAGRVGRAEVGLVREVTATFRSWRDRYGGGACRDALAGQVRWAAGLIRGRADGATRRALHSAVGYLADMAGWGDVDAGHHETALSFFRLALHCAEEAEDWTLRAEVLSDLSQQAVYRGQLDDALSLIELAQVRADRVAGTGRAMLSCAHARILGAAGRASECRSAVSAAENHFAAHQSTDEWVGSPFFEQASQANLMLDNGRALFCWVLVTPMPPLWPVTSCVPRSAIPTPSGGVVVPWAPLGSRRWSCCTATETRASPWPTGRSTSATACIPRGSPMTCAGSTAPPPGTRARRSRRSSSDSTRCWFRPSAWPGSRQRADHRLPS